MVFQRVFHFLSCWVTYQSEFTVISLHTSLYPWLWRRNFKNSTFTQIKSVTSCEIWVLIIARLSLWQTTEWNWFCGHSAWSSCHAPFVLIKSQINTFIAQWTQRWKCKYILLTLKSNSNCNQKQNQWIQSFILLTFFMF